MDYARGGEASTSKPSSPGRGTFRRDDAFIEQPSAKYTDVKLPSNTVMQRACSPPAPVLPRRQGTRSWQATQRERYPLTSTLTGRGATAMASLHVIAASCCYHHAICCLLKPLCLWPPCLNLRVLRPRHSCTELRLPLVLPNKVFFLCSTLQGLAGLASLAS